jgi:hypothetical protein
MLVIPTIAAPSQILSVSLAGQSCRINLYEKTPWGLFLDLYVNDALIIAGTLCQDTLLTVRDKYLGFIGDLTFIDTQGSDDPLASGLGARWLFIYIEASELWS